MSTLPKTWIFDIDGTIAKHNGYEIDGMDTLLVGVKEYFDKIPKEDYILLLTSRKEEFRKITIEFLKKHAIRYNEILFGMPLGERIVINDRKLSGIDMAIAFNVERNKFILPQIKRQI